MDTCVARGSADIPTKLIILSGLRCLQRGWKLWAPAAIKYRRYPADVVVGCHDGHRAVVWVVKLMKEPVPNEVVTTTDAHSHLRSHLEKLRTFNLLMPPEYRNAHVKFVLRTTQTANISKSEHSEDCIVATGGMVSLFNKQQNAEIYTPCENVASAGEIENISLFSDEAANPQLSNIIKDAISKLYKTTGFETKHIQQLLYYHVMEWWRGCDDFTETNAAWQECFEFLVTKLSVNIPKTVDFTEDSLTAIRKNIMSNPGTFIKCNSSEFDLVIQKIRQVVPEGIIFPVSLKTFTKRWLTIEQIWNSSWYHIVIILVSGEWKASCQLLGFLDDHPDKKMIVLGSRLVEPDVGFCVMSDYVTLKDFDSSSLNRVMSRKFVFQGRTITLNTFTDNSISSNIKRNISGESALQLLASDTNFVGKKLEVPFKYSIPRTVTIKNNKGGGSKIVRTIHDLNDRACIVANSGVGKTQFLKNIAFKTKVKHPHLFVVVINMNEAIRSSEASSPEKVLQRSAFHHKNGSKLEEEVLKFCKSTGNLVLLVDGLDEVCENDFNKAAELCSRLSQIMPTVVHFWVVGSMRVWTTLSQLNFTSYSLNSFSYEDTLHFFRYYRAYEDVHLEDSEIADLASSLLAIKNVGAPMLARLVAELCKEKEAMKTEKIHGASSIYRRYLEWRLQAHDEEGCNGSKLLQHHQYLAVKYLLGEKIHLQACEAIAERMASLKRDEIDLILEVGVVTHFNVHEIVFEHHSFAEYLVASWLVEHRDRERRFIQESKENTYLASMWTFYDDLLTADTGFDGSQRPGLEGNPSSGSTLARLKQHHGDT